MKAKDIMRTKVITVEACLTLPELARLFHERGITGAPVLDAEGGILGVVSQTDLVRSRRESAEGVAVYHKETEDAARSAGMHIEELSGMRVEEIMTPGAISFDEETPIEDVARSMLELHIHRVLITRGGKLKGIVTTMDMLRALLGRGGAKTSRKARVLVG